MTTESSAMGQTTAPEGSAPRMETAGERGARENMARSLGALALSGKVPQQELANYAFLALLQDNIIKHGRWQEDVGTVFQGCFPKTDEQKVDEQQDKFKYWKGYVGESIKQELKKNGDFRDLDLDGLRARVRANVESGIFVTPYEGGYANVVLAPLTVDVNLQNEVIGPLDWYGNIADPQFRLGLVDWTLANLQKSCADHGIPANRADVLAIVAQLNALRPPLAAKEGRPIIITSETAEAEYRAAGPTPGHKLQWVRDRITEIRKTLRMPDGLAGKQVDYDLLAGSVNAIYDDNPYIWLEAQYAAPTITIGLAAKGSTEFQHIVDRSSSVTAELFETEFGLKIRQQNGGAVINGVAEGFRLLEHYRAEYYNVPKDDKGGWLRFIGWLLEGYPEAQARNFATATTAQGLPMYEDPPNLWATQAAHDIWIGTMRTIIPVRNARGEIVKRSDSVVFPAYRLAGVQESAKTKPDIVPFFRGEGRQFIDPYFMDFWSYMALNEPEKIGVPYGFLRIEGPRWNRHYVMNENLEHVRFELIPFKQSVQGADGKDYGGINAQLYSKFAAYAANCDKYRALLEQGGVFNTPTMEVFAKQVSELKLWEKTESEWENNVTALRSQAICQVAEAIMEYQKRYVAHGFDPRRERRIELSKLLGPPFNIEPNDPALKRLKAEYL